MDVVRHTERLARRVARLEDTSLRFDYVRHELQRIGADGVLALLAVLHAPEAVRRAGLGELALAVVVGLAHPECASLREAVARLAVQRGDQAAVRLVQRDAGRAWMASSDDRTPTPATREGWPLTLGERKSLARRRDRKLIARALGDPSPEVVRVLLGNPALTEDDVVRLCARRPVPSAVLREVFCHPRWVVRPRVRAALVKNPWTPLDVGLALVPHLGAHDAREAAALEDLSPVVRHACRCLRQPALVH